MYVPAWQGMWPSLLMGAGSRYPLPYPLSAPVRRTLYLARSGIYHAARALVPSPRMTALVPDYHNGLEVLALRRAGCIPRFYRIDRGLEPDLDAIQAGLRAGARLVLVIHFNGWPQPVDAIRSLCREHGAFLIEDCALAFLSEWHGAPLGSFGDASVFCLYKTLPVPHGAVIAANGAPAASIASLKLRAPDALSTAARTAELTITRVRGRVGPLGAALADVKGWVGNALSVASVKRAPVGSMVFDDGLLDLGMSPWAERLLPRFDCDSIRARRRANYQRLLGVLDGCSTPLQRSLPDGVCPLFFPLLVRDKREAVASLAREGIEAVEFWNAGDPEAEGEGHEDAMELRRHVIELPVHQDLNPEQIDHIARTVTTLELRGPDR